MAILFEKHTAPAEIRPPGAAPDPEGSRLDVAVVFTSVETTLAALRHAGALARNLAGRVRLVIPQVVPFPLPLASPPVLLDWSERRFRLIAESCSVDTAVQLYLCRDRDETLLKALGPRTLVVLGGRRRWWRLTSEWALARKLRRVGHEVVFVETE